MKKILYLVLLIGAQVSCSPDDRVDSEGVTPKLDPEKFPQKWELKEMSSSWGDITPTTGMDMEWQEYYIFNADKTFTKSRERDGVTLEESGTYERVTENDVEFLKLTFDKFNDALVGSCTSLVGETLVVTSQTELTGTWSWCDGPGLLYGRVE